MADDRGVRGRPLPCAVLPVGEKPLGLFLPNITSTTDGNHFARLGRF
jgi:hypothetical protein